MKRLNTIFVAVGAALAITVLASEVQSRSSHTLAIAEKACLDQSIKPQSTAFEKCVERVADAYDRTGQMPKVTWPTASVGQRALPASAAA